MKINKNKCEFLSIGQEEPLTFSDGTQLFPIDEVKDLSCKVNKKADGNKEVKAQIRECLAILTKLKTLLVTF